VEITTQRLEVVKGLEETHSLLAEIKTRQQAMVTKERELAALEQSIMDRVRMISDDTKAILAKLSEGLEE
jgi:predicted  nucleic acid-binding Zn-ribbon protein